MSETKSSGNNVILWVLGGLGCLVVGGVVAVLLLFSLGGAASYTTIQQANTERGRTEVFERQAMEAAAAAEAARAEEAEAARAAAEAARLEAEETRRLEAERAQPPAAPNAPSNPDDPLTGLDGL